MEHQRQRAALDDFADDREIQLPLLEDRFGKILAAGLQNHQHALLALAQHHLVRRHPLLADRHLVEIEPQADAALRRHFDAGGGQARRAHVLDGDDGVRRHQLEARLDQQLLGERVADLHGRPLFLAVVIEFGARHGGAMDAVAPGLRADIDHRIADAGGGRIENLVLLGDADGHRVDQDVAVVRLVEIGLAADGRHADAIAIAADAGNDALDQMLHLRRVDLAKAQRVHVGDRPRAHGEDVAQDAADAGRRALVRLDEARVVVAFHLEDGGVAIADVDDAGILARALDDPGRLGRQLGQMDARRFVGAMLRPHHRKDAEFEHVRHPPHGGDDALIFLGGKAVLGDDLGGDFGHGAADSEAARRSHPLCGMVIALTHCSCYVPILGRRRIEHDDPRDRRSRGGPVKGRQSGRHRQDILGR